MYKWSPDGAGPLVHLDKATPLSEVLHGEAQRAIQQQLGPVGRAVPTRRTRARKAQQYSAYCTTGTKMDLLYSPDPNWKYYARGHGFQWCSGASGQQVSSWLWRNFNGWQSLDGPVFTAGPGNLFIHAYTFHNCNHTGNYLYEANADGAVYVGVWVVGPPVSDSAYHTCPG